MLLIQIASSIVHLSFSLNWYSLKQEGKISTPFVKFVYKIVSSVLTNLSRSSLVRIDHPSMRLRNTSSLHEIVRPPIG
ncbi:hypothetical protein EUGRSUZ_I01353 [Eucalyptus grandis]|uniref:Uncharacterized protein n=2 Tax=Eucalyptus grandis TaxID=71139 RepID=A0ACC3JEF0_EUCGR|nr:hypothetical protein EUGRSUZ_I01353 [Eucalyptus grandis]